MIPNGDEWFEPMEKEMVPPDFVYDETKNVLVYSFEYFNRSGFEKVGINGEVFYLDNGCLW